MNKQRIVRVESDGMTCEILAQSPTEARQIAARCRREGVWEAVKGTRWQRISASAIVSIKILPASPK